MKLLALLVLLVPAVAAAQTPVWRVQPATGFIDDAFALRPDGNAIAWLTTDGSGPSTLHLQAIDTSPAPETVVPGLPSQVSSLWWLDNERLLVVNKTGASQLSAQVWSAKGASPEKLGPVDRLALSTVDGKPVVVTYDHVEKKNDHVLVAILRDTWKPLRKVVLHEGSDGKVNHKAGSFRILWWSDGLTSAATQQSGVFDKARDMLRPSRYGRFDAFVGPNGTVIVIDEISDVVGFATAQQIHAKHGPGDLFVELGEDHRDLFLIDGLSRRAVELARPLVIYEAESIAQQHVDDGRLLVSATVDPTNPPALKRQKVDKDDFDLFVIDKKAATSKLVLRLPGQGRPTAWHVAGLHAAVLRKSKGFGRGGVALEIFNLAE